MLWLCHSCLLVMLRLLLWLLHQPEERLCYGCHATRERINVSAVPMAPWVSFQSPSLCLAYPGFRGHCRQREQQDSHQMHLPQISTNVWFWGFRTTDDRSIVTYPIRLWESTELLTISISTLNSTWHTVSATSEWLVIFMCKVLVRLYEGALAHSGCYNKNTIDCIAYTAFGSHSSGGWEVKIQTPADSVSGKVSPPSSRCIPPQKGGGSSLVFPL